MAMIDVVAAGGAGRTEASDTVSFAAGRQAYRAEDYARAMTILAPLAEAGDPVAQYYVAHMYEKGDGVAKDASKTLSSIVDRPSRAMHGRSTSSLLAMHKGGPGWRRTKPKPGGGW
jgi:TPR repeat protein